MLLLAAHQLDFYKVHHPDQYPVVTTEVYSNLTARSGKRSNIPNTKGVVYVGGQMFVMDILLSLWNETFFCANQEYAVNRYLSTVGLHGNVKAYNRMAALHELGYLPLEVKALAEGSLVPYGVPMMTFRNTHSDFAWITNSIESVASAYLWQLICTATTTVEYLKVFMWYAEQTGANRDFIYHQAHNFSYRGLGGPEQAARNGLAAVLVGAKGTDCVPALDLIKFYYEGQGTEATSIPATEHSVMCAGGMEDEFGTFSRLINEVYPDQPISIVSDTWDFWQVVTEFLPRLKNDILARDATNTVVIRPDSGDPVKIICGDEESANTAERKGLVECLWDIFGGTINKEGYKVLNPRIGAIYGDSITPERQNQILGGLRQKRFASSNIVLGVGSYTYQYVTRDTHGMAIKATSCVINGVRHAIYKNPKTDDGTKKSAKGLLMVERDASGNYYLEEDVTPKQERKGALKTIFKDSELFNRVTADDVRREALYLIEDL